MLCFGRNDNGTVTSSEVERSQSLYKTVEISSLHFVSVEMTLVLSPRAKSKGLNHYIWTVEISPLHFDSVEKTKGECRKDVSSVTLIKIWQWK